MRIHLKIQASNKVIPFDHQALLTGTIHKWLGWNDEHGKISLYSFSRLEGGTPTKRGLQFERESTFFFSAYQLDLIKTIIKGIQSDPTMFHGLFVSDITIQEEPDLSGRDLFYVASPVFIKRKVGERMDHILFDDIRASTCMIETLRTKMAKAEIEDRSLEIRFDTNYSKAGTKKITYNGIENKASWCPVIIKGKPETKLFAWNVGIGNSTGIGFGAIK